MASQNSINCNHTSPNMSAKCDVSRHATNPLISTLGFEKICLITKLLSVFVLSLPANALAQSCYETTVQSPTPFMGNSGEIIKLADGSLWEVKYAYEYLYEYSPSVIICPKSRKLMVKNKSIDVEPISSGSSAGSHGQPIIESTIFSTFEGLNEGNIYKLANGQIWEQVEPWVWVWIWINPKVTIYAASGAYKMIVENIEHPVLVRRLK